MSADVEMIRVYIMGRPYEVPSGLTIMKAMEYTGYRLVRGVGCRGGFCGACATVFRRAGDYKLYADLACQTTAEDGMYIAQIPSVPAERAPWKLSELDPEENTILALYPEVARCVACNTCTRACPQELEVMDYIQAALRGDIRQVAELSFDCVQCGLCAMRCPAEIVHYHVGQLARRVYGAYLAPQSPHLAARVEEIKKGAFDQDLDKLQAMSKDELVEAYRERDVEA
ncbi:MAG: 4Fe-4S dicluster domain-containing protein [Candidatus Bipolaricaulota bacterium]